MDASTRTTARRVLVIGGGLTGLVAATAAAQAGAPVRLLEAGRSLGGRARTSQHDGFKFNLGPHALYRAGAGMPALRELGIEPDGAQPVRGFRAERDRRLFRLPVGPASLLVTGLLSPPDKLAAVRVMEKLPRLDPRGYDQVSWQAVRDALTARPSLRQLLDSLVRLSTYAHAPETLSAGAALDQLRIVQSGVLYLHGGWGRLVQSLASKAEAAGVDIACRTAAHAVRDGGTGPSVEVGDGRAETAAVVILALPLAEAKRLADTAACLDAAADALLPARTASLDVGLSALPVPKRTFALGIDRPTYVGVHSATARLAPESGHVVHAARYLAPDEAPERDALLAELEDALERLQPGWREHVVQRRFAPDLRVADGLPHAAAGGLAARPRVDALGDRGILLAGDWVGPAGLLSDAGRASALEAGRRAAEYVREAAA